MDNAMEDLLYADAKNCALLKEAVMNFLAANHYEASEKISFKDVPGHVVKDLLVAVGVGNNSNSKKDAVDELSTLCVSALRRKLDEMGLDVDGSREAMIESIKHNVTDSDDDVNKMVMMTNNEPSCPHHHHPITSTVADVPSQQ